MSLSHLTKSISFAVGTLGLVTVSNLLFLNSAHGFGVTFVGSPDGNGSFESPIVGGGLQNGWNTIGDVTTTGTINSIAPTDPASAPFNQAIITTGYIQNNDSDPLLNRNDDNGFTFNQSGTNPVNSDTDAHELQDHLNLSPEAFSIPRVGGTFPNPRTSKEASGMYQEFTVTLDSGETGFTVEFDWSYLTNDSSTTLGGEQDFGFWNLGQYNSGTDTYTTAFDNIDSTNPNQEIIVLKSSSDPIINAPTGDNDYGNTYDYITNTRYSYNVDNLAPGSYTYRVGFGVVDVDKVEDTSALLIDTFVVQEIPFEFSPSLGVIFMTGFWGINYLRRR